MTESRTVRQAREQDKGERKKPPTCDTRDGVHNLDWKSQSRKEVTPAGRTLVPTPLRLKPNLHHVYYYAYVTFTLSTFKYAAGPAPAQLNVKLTASPLPAAWKVHPKVFHVLYGLFAVPEREIEQPGYDEAIS